jgi:hypothetical protein
LLHEHFATIVDDDVDEGEIPSVIPGQPPSPVTAVSSGFAFRKH